MPAAPKQREHSLDVIRAIAIIAVICEHTSSALLTGKAQLLVNTLGTLGVPLFVMLTGYLMLDRSYDSRYLQRFLKHNLLPLVITLEIWNITWFGLSQVIGDSPISFDQVLKVALFMGPTNNGMWFLPMIIGVYLGLPIVSHTIQWLGMHHARTYSLTLLGCAAFFGTIVPTLSELFSFIMPQHIISSQLNMNIFGADVWGNSVWILFLLAGYAVKKGIFSKVNTWAATAVAIVSAVFLVLFHHFALASGLAWDPYYANLFLVITAISSFVVGQRIFTLRFAHARFLVTVTTFISTYSFSVYMLHFWILTVCVACLQSFNMSTGFISFAIIVCICLVGSLAVARILAYLRPLQRWMLLIK
ncbi:acyltransferase [Bifidobacterium lemurum]|uniref:Acyltransferase n=1 Tax=Bifidobacterium lemurum TaxID=1603886 RepID=A0A261FRJ4_9BIFI|nr:acyltransferase [Bifidobacterium lemurum]OZG61777.1 acyltransferase [Bifidobacterium lemurum]QOL34930.1 acyltransferase [Bifidobacterium lemurum]